MLEPANWLTVIRLPMAAALWIAPDSKSWIYLMLALAAVTDMLDGRVAAALRKRRLARGDDREAVGRSQAVGAWLDPLCDKTFILSALAAIYVCFELEPWMLAALAAREIVLVPFAVAYRLSTRLQHMFRFDFRAGYLGKLATVAQFTSMLWILLEQPQLGVVVSTTGIFGILAALYYLRKAVHMARWLTTNELAYSKWLELQAEVGGKL